MENIQETCLQTVIVFEVHGYDSGEEMTHFKCLFL